jgi:hypothetical protein
MVAIAGQVADFDDGIRQCGNDERFNIFSSHRHVA